MCFEVLWIDAGIWVHLKSEMCEQRTLALLKRSMTIASGLQDASNKKSLVRQDQPGKFCRRSPLKMSEIRRFLDSQFS